MISSQKKLKKKKKAKKDKEEKEETEKDEIVDDSERSGSQSEDEEEVTETPKKDRNKEKALIRIEDQDVKDTEESKVEVIVKRSSDKKKKSPGSHKKSDESDDFEKSAEVLIDEEFFADLLLPAVVHVLGASIPVNHIPLFNILLAMNIGVKRDTVLVEELDLIVEMLVASKKPEQWKQEDILKENSDTLNKESIDNMVQIIRRFKMKEFEPIFEKLYELLPATSTHFSSYNLTLSIFCIAQISKNKLTLNFEELTFFRIQRDELEKNRS